MNGRGNEERSDSARSPVALTVLALVSACGAVGPAGAPRAASGSLDYLVRLDPALERMDVRVCFEDEPGASMFPGIGPGDELIGAWDAEGRPLPTRPGRIDTTRVEPGECLRYAIDFRVAARMHDRENGARVARAGRWLWRPFARTDQPRGTLRFELPEGIEASVPWPLRGDGHDLDEGAFRFLAWTAFGRFERTTIDVGGGRLDVVVLPGATSGGMRVIRRWLTEAARAVSLLDGRFPSEQVQVIVMPVGPGPDEVAFGMIGRGGGASVLLLLRENADEEALVRDWVAVHELAHLAFPYLRGEDAWLSEGIATYYQEVLRARAGLVSPLVAWRHIDDGCQRGRRRSTGLTLDEESARMHETRAYERVYWAGAAFALEADVALRTRRERPTSLDAVIARVNEEWRRAPRAWTERDVIAALDAAGGDGLFAELRERYGTSTVAPDPEPVFPRLGLVRGEDGLLAYGERAPLAHVRDAIMGGEASTAIATAAASAR